MSVCSRGQKPLHQELCVLAKMVIRTVSGTKIQDRNFVQTGAPDCVFCLTTQVDLFENRRNEGTHRFGSGVLKILLGILLNMATSYVEKHGILGKSIFFLQLTPSLSIHDSPVFSRGHDVQF